MQWIASSHSLLAMTTGGADACIVIANASEAIEIYKAWLLASASRKSPRIFNLYGSLRQRRAQGMPGAFDSARSLACE